MIAAWKPPPLVPVMLMRAGSTSASREQVVERAHAVPHFPTREVGSGCSQIAEHGELAANQVVAAYPEASQNWLRSP